jgi:small subunit ribosomal protein S9
MATVTSDKYIETVGRRKTASARVRLMPSGKQSITVNGKAVDDFFSTKELADNALLPLKHAEGKFTITAVIRGGGISGQSDALRHGIARALTVHDSSKRGDLKKVGLLKRDARAKERRKPGLKKARKRPQWSKR